MWRAALLMAYRLTPIHIGINENAYHLTNGREWELISSGGWVESSHLFALHTASPHFCAQPRIENFFLGGFPWLDADQNRPT